MTFVEHLNSCARQCIAIADMLEKSFRCGIPVQRDYLIAGSLLADVGKPLEYDKDGSGKVIQGKFGQQVRHPFSGVALAYKHGIPGEVMHIIATHSHEGDKVERSIESIIFHHADFVDFDIAKFLESGLLKNNLAQKQMTRISASLIGLQLTSADCELTPGFSFSIIFWCEKRSSNSSK